MNWGGSVGGPIINNKTFYFVSFERQNYIIGLSGLATEPSDAWVNKALALMNTHGVAESTLSKNLIGSNGFWPRSLIGGLPATTHILRHSSLWATWHASSTAFRKAG